MATVRDKFSFHFDKDPFLKWLDAASEYDAVTLYVIESAPESRDIVFEASAAAVHAAFRELHEPGFVRDLALVAVAVPHIVDAMIYGFMHQCGLQIRPLHKGQIDRKRPQA